MPAAKRRIARSVIGVTMPQEVARLISRAAQTRHETLSGFLRNSAVERANRVLGIEPSEPKEAATVAA